MPSNGWDGAAPVYHRCMTIDLVGRVATPMADMDEAAF